MPKLLKYWKPQKNGDSVWSTPKGGFDLFAITKVYRTNERDVYSFPHYSFYQRGEVVYRDHSEHRLYNVSLLHDTKGKPYAEGTLYDCDKAFVPEYTLDGDLYTRITPNLYQSAQGDLSLRERGTLVKFNRSKMKWVDKHGAHVPWCKMLLFDMGIVDDKPSRNGWRWEEQIFAY